MIFDLWKARLARLIPWRVLVPVRGSTHQLDNGLIECVESWVLDPVLWFPVPIMRCGE